MQRISIAENYGTRFDRVARTERDRPGGHGPTPVKNGIDWGKEYMRPKGRKFCKKMFAKKARRQHARIKQDALRDLGDDFTENLSSEWLDEEFMQYLGESGKLQQYRDCVQFDYEIGKVIAKPKPDLEDWDYIEPASKLRPAPENPRKRARGGSRQGDQA